MDNFFVKDKDGNPVFIGREDPSNPPVKPMQGSKIQCSVCQTWVDYLVGENTSDGGIQGCEGCWKPSKHKIASDNPIDPSKEIM